MLRCGRCGCRKFIFTTPDDKVVKHHGAICAACHKRLNVRDISTQSAEFSSGWPATWSDDSPVYRYSGKP